MTHFMNRFLVLLASLMLALGLHAQDVTRDKVVQAMRTGNATELAAQLITALASFDALGVNAARH